MAGVGTAVVFMTVMIGSQGTNYGAPTVQKETMIIDGTNSMSVCRRMESNFHMGSITVNGEVKVSSEKYGSNNVRRESSCTQITL